MGPITRAYCRKCAAQFYLKHPNGIVHDWIDTGEDPLSMVDKDIKELAVLLWDTARLAEEYGVNSVRET